jgi:hypothetical protein
MMTVDSTADTCPDPNELAAFGGGAPGDPAAEAVLEHLASCSTCRGLVSLVARQSDPRLSEEPPLLPDAMASFGAAPTRSPDPQPHSRRAAVLLVFLALSAGVMAWALRGNGDWAVGGDPVAAESVRAALSRVELLPAEVDLDPAAVPRRLPALLPLEPRGAHLHAPKQVVLWASVPIQGAVVVLEDDGESPRVHARWEVPHAIRTVTLPMPTLRSGMGYYRLRVLDREGRETARAFFRVLGADEAELLGRAQARIASRLAGGTARDFARAELLLARGLAREALAVAGNLAEAHPSRREPARLALAALQALGLRDSPDWVRWRAAYDEGR